MTLKCFIVLDTNILVSAVLSKTGKARHALDKAQNIGTVLMSSAVLSEVEEVLFRPKFDRYVTQFERRFFLSNFLKMVEFVAVREVIQICRDPKDDKILALALSGKAEYIVTGDRDLLVLKCFQEIKIVTIEQFLTL